MWQPHWLAVVAKAPCTAENATEPQVSGPVWYESHSKGLTTIHLQLGEDVEKEMCACVIFCQTTTGIINCNFPDDLYCFNGIYDAWSNIFTAH